MNRDHEHAHTLFVPPRHGKVLQARGGRVDLGDGKLLRERRPSHTVWSRRGIPDGLPELRHALAASAWKRRAVSVLSALEQAEYPRGGGAGPQWHISIAAGMGEPELRRPTSDELRWTLAAFGMAKAEEDNHHPGNARHFWLPVDPTKRVGCECKESETTITEPDGYQWTTPVDGPCRGCEFAALELGKPCPIHGAGGEVAP